MSSHSAKEDDVCCGPPVAFPPPFSTSITTFTTAVPPPSAGPGTASRALTFHVLRAAPLVLVAATTSSATRVAWSSDATVIRVASTPVVPTVGSSTETQVGVPAAPAAGSASSGTRAARSRAAWSSGATGTRAAGVPAEPAAGAPAVLAASVPAAPATRAAGALAAPADGAASSGTRAARKTSHLKPNYPDHSTRKTTSGTTPPSAAKSTSNQGASQCRPNQRECRRLSRNWHCHRSRGRSSVVK